MKFVRYLVAAMAALSISACGANDSDQGFGKGSSHHGSPSNGGGGSQNQGTAGSGGSEDNPQLDAGVPFPPQDAAPMPDGDTCSAQVVEAKPYPLDMYVMMDQSGSMQMFAGMGVPPISKWQAVVNAFQQFLTQNQTTGLGMGIQYFPLPAKPWSSFRSCSSSNPCPNNGICINYDGGKCMPTCRNSSECPPNTECIEQEDSNHNKVRFCTNTTCETAPYQKPDVPIGPLPQNNAALLNSLKSHRPTTMTPTRPALHGAIEYARQWAKQHTDHKVIVVLATDGMPSVCDASSKHLVEDVVNEARAGVQGNPSIKTFVIGVVMNGDILSGNNLNRMAQAGGTGQAFIVDPNKDMTAAFTQALQNIRGAAMKCEFHVPPESYLDLNKVNVVYVAIDGKHYTVYHVSDITKCDPKLGGWYYDKNPPDRPSKIILCPNSCDFMQKAGGKISIEIGCETIEMPK